MSNRDDPGNMPAFPTPPSPGVHGTIPGMSLREYYAGLAMQGMMAGGERPGATDIAVYSVTVADALLAALAGRNDG